VQAPFDPVLSTGGFVAADINRLPPRVRLRGLVTTILASHTIVRPFSDDDTLAEVGLASVDMVTLMLAVENEFNVEIPQSEITAEVFRSVSTLEDLILRLVPLA
jgi:acyl carrier protein